MLVGSHLTDPIDPLFDPIATSARSIMDRDDPELTDSDDLDDDDLASDSDLFTAEE